MLAIRPTTRRKINLDAINKAVVLTPRVYRLRHVHLTTEMTKVSAERSPLYLESWKQSEGHHPVIRRAKAFQHFLENKEIVIRDDELIVGSTTRYPRGVYPNPEECAPHVGRVLKEAIENCPDSVKEAFEGDDVNTLLQCCEFWNDKYPGARLDRKIKEVAGDRYTKMIQARLVSTPPSLAQGFRSSPDWDTILSKGLNGMITEARERMALLRQSPVTNEAMEKLNWYEAVIISLQAMMAVAGRHARLARELAAKEHHLTRRGELERIAEICDRVPANPPRSFYEALQFQWFIALGIDWEKCTTATRLGRFDQYMWPYYYRDIEEGQMTHAEAGELLGCMFVKLMGMEFFAADFTGNLKKQDYRATFAPQNYGMNITLGGVDRQGHDATNELSVFMVEALRQVKPQQPHLSIRFHRAMSPELIDKTIECNSEGGGNPAWFNDRHGTEYLLALGLPIEEARDWQVNGCTYITHKAAGGQREIAGFFNHAKLIELALNDGVDPVAGERLGPPTGDPRSFCTFEDVVEAYKRQFDYVLELTVRLLNSTWAIAIEDATYFPFVSALVAGQLELGRDATRGGRYPGLWADGVGDRGHPDAADSLTAIRRLVFEDKKSTMDQLLTALAADFEGYDDIRQMCLAAPKYGNDDDEADAMMTWVWKNATDSIKQYRDANGQRIGRCTGQPFWATWAGGMVGALPNGRKAGTSLCDAAASPMHGQDRKGFTAVLNSVAKCCDHAAYVEATTLNQRFSPSVLRSKANREKLAAAIACYFDGPTYQIQFNVFDKEMLLDAMKNPADYRDLVIRVAGYSAFWVDLKPEVQLEILSRTEQRL
jgi:formate C-acetyltransferase